MTVRSARVVTYTLVGLFSVVAVRMTPPIGATPGSRALGGFSQQTADALAEEQESATPEDRELIGRQLEPHAAAPGVATVAPVVVVASNRERVDTVTVSGTIQSSLFSALDKSGSGALPRAARAELAFSLADIFEYRVDMSKDLQVGDKFHILVERLQKPNGAIIVNKILGARLALSGNEIDAIRFESRAASGQYFDEGGKSLRASFLRAPVAFRRISSIFGGRRHPVLGIWRRHKGTDYAAAMGTPVRSIGDGVVVFAGRKGGYGNVIDIRHRNGFVSRYGHLRNFSKGIHTGTRVTIGSTIGAVGKSGLATGPHLHFEVLVNGVQRDPRIALRMKGGEPIPSSERGVFQRIRNRTLATFGALASSSN
ncbi:MAG TPA: M23 family metallopeptidase [Gemmatimonadaceae bacterium]|nr:M23 family metallopeptidase [Gemmatimonadaceae bacterium]